MKDVSNSQASKVKLDVTNVDSLNQLQLFSVANPSKEEKIPYGERKYVYAIFSKD